MTSNVSRIVKFGIWLPVAVWGCVKTTFLVVVALLPKPSNEAAGMGTFFDVLGIFLMLFFVLGLFTFVTVAIASLRTLYIGRRAPISRTERTSALCGVVVPILFFCLAGYLFAVRSWDINL